MRSHDAYVEELTSVAVWVVGPAGLAGWDRAVDRSQGAAGTGVGFGIGLGVGFGVGLGVGLGVGVGVGVGVGLGVGFGDLGSGAGGFGRGAGDFGSWPGFFGGLGPRPAPWPPPPPPWPCPACRKLRRCACEVSPDAARCAKGHAALATARTASAMLKVASNVFAIVAARPRWQLFARR